ncbi:MAG: FHA domain-containing protein [Deltaproteobacteria bacterium]|nr:MAG: FHA domain-containing protein [Deltaproteobacteria bacterium]
MFTEPLVQDYLEIAIKVEAEQFCKQVPPVLVEVFTDQQPAFQRPKTAMHDAGPPKPRKLLDHRRRVFELGSPSKGFGVLTLGRSEENSLVVQDETVSSRHVRLTRVRTTGQILLEDLGSTNGTYVNGKMVIQGRAVELHDGDMVGLGDTLFVFMTPGGFWRRLKELGGDAY